MTEKLEEVTEITNLNQTLLPDELLQTLVNMINGKDIELPITLFVGGLIVSGQLVSGHRYFGEGLEPQMKECFGISVDEDIEFFNDRKNLYLKEEKLSSVNVAYIHLRESRAFINGQNPIPTSGCWWRGRLSRVDGFHFGTLSLS